MAADQSKILHGKEMHRTRQTPQTASASGCRCGKFRAKNGRRRSVPSVFGTPDEMDQPVEHKTGEGQAKLHSHVAVNAAAGPLLHPLIDIEVGKGSINRVSFQAVLILGLLDELPVLLVRLNPI